MPPFVTHEKDEKTSLHSPESIKPTTRIKALALASFSFSSVGYEMIEIQEVRPNTLICSTTKLLVAPTYLLSKASSSFLP